MNHAGHAYPNNINDDDQIPSDIVDHNGHNQTNGISPKLNGIQSFNAPSPATDSPATPVSNVAVPDVKIDMDYQEQESDARHEPFPIKLIDDQLDKGNVVTEITSNDQGTPPVHPPTTATTTTTTTNNNVNNMKHPNGHTSPSPHHQQHQHPDDIVMADTDSQLAHTPGISQDFSMASIDTNYNSQQSTTRSYPDDNDDQREPPAKRARVHSDADMASTAHSATPPPASAVMSHATSPVPPPPTSSTTAPPTTATSTMSYANLESTLTINQYRFCLSTIRSLKKSKDAAPFLRPVDPVALNIPHYPSIIKTPMDVSTIERKLASSNPAKPDPNDYNPRYLNADEFSGDVRQIYNNTATFNGPEHVITAMGKRMLELFEKMMKNMPANEKPKPPPVKKIEKIATPPPPPPPVVAPPPKKLPPAARRASTSVPVIRRSDRPEAEPASAARPKREIHPPPPKDLPYQDLPKKRKHKKTQDDGTAEQLKYCNKILQEMHKKQHWTIANPFYEPVDWQKLDIPMYPKIIKKPMDLSTMRRRLDAGHYETAQGFYDDFKLMIRNCFTFNPPGSPVNSAGQDLQRLFDEKWKGLPPLITHEPSEDEEDEEDDSEVERQRAIAQMESQIESMRDKLTQLKNKAPKEKKKKEKKEKAPVASTSKPPPKPPKAAPAPPPKKKSKKPIADDDVLTFDQKKDLSEAIGRLEGAPLERVIQIIHEGVPEIRDSTEEIELEIDLLPAAVLTKLYNYVIRPIKQQQAAPKRNRTGKGTGTGGLKRKSMDEEKEAEKIRQLEERMALFDRGADASGHSASARRHHDSEHSSDSSSGSDSSGSDSE